MLKTLLPLPTALLVACGVEGNGHLTTESRNQQGFTAVECRLPVAVVVHEAEAFAIAVTIDSNLQSLVTTDVRGDTLVLDTTDEIQPSGGARIEVSMPAVRGLTNLGSGSVEATDTTKTEALTLRNEGSGELLFRGPASELDATLSGSGDLSFDLRAAVLPMRSASLHSSGSGSLTVTADSASWSLHSDGSGTAHLSGTAQVVNFSSSGSGGADARSLTTRDGTLSCSGSGSISLTANGGAVTVAIDGSGNVELYGSSSVNVTSQSGSGRLIRH